MSQCVPPWVYPSWDSLCFLDSVEYFSFPMFKNFSAIFKYFLRSFLSLFSFYNPYNVNVDVFNIVLEVSPQHSENEDHGIWSHHFMGNRWGNSGNSVRFYFFGAPKSLQMVTAAMKSKDAYSLEEKLCPT